MNEKRKEWIEKSYTLVAEKGYESLNINSISRLVGKSKSSFYHHFGNKSYTPPGAPRGF